MRVDCDDCSMNFQTKKLYIKHIKSKECSKSKRSNSPNYPTHPSKKPRLEIIPQSSSTPLSSIQSQISQLSQQQKVQLQAQLAQKQRQALQNIPFNQLSEKQREALKRLTPSGKVVITKNSDPISIAPISNQSAKSKSRRSSKAVIVQEVSLLNEEDDLPVVSDFVFSDEPIAAESDDDEKNEETKAPIPVSSVTEMDTDSVDYGSIKIKGISKEQEGRHK